MATEQQELIRAMHRLTEGISEQTRVLLSSAIGASSSRNSYQQAQTTKESKSDSQADKMRKATLAELKKMNSTERAAASERKTQLKAVKDVMDNVLDSYRKESAITDTIVRQFGTKIEKVEQMRADATGLDEFQQQLESVIDSLKGKSKLDKDSRKQLKKLHDIRAKIVSGDSEYSESLKGLVKQTNVAALSYGDPAKASKVLAARLSETNDHVETLGHKSAKLARKFENLAIAQEKANNILSFGSTSFFFFIKETLGAFKNQMMAQSSVSAYDNIWSGIEYDTMLGLSQTNRLIALRNGSEEQWLSNLSQGADAIKEYTGSLNEGAKFLGSLEMSLYNVGVAGDQAQAAAVDLFKNMQSEANALGVSFKALGVSNEDVTQMVSQLSQDADVRKQLIRFQKGERHSIVRNIMSLTKLGIAQGQTTEQAFELSKKIAGLDKEKSPAQIMKEVAMDMALATVTGSQRAIDISREIGGMRTKMAQGMVSVEERAAYNTRIATLKAEQADITNQSLQGDPGSMYRSQVIFGEGSQFKAGFDDLSEHATVREKQTAEQLAHLGETSKNTRDANGLLKGMFYSMERLSNSFPGNTGAAITGMLSGVLPKLIGALLAIVPLFRLGGLLFKGGKALIGSSGFKRAIAGIATVSGLTLAGTGIAQAGGVGEANKQVNSWMGITSQSSSSPATSEMDKKIAALAQTAGAEAIMELTKNTDSTTATTESATAKHREAAAKQNQIITDMATKQYNMLVSINTALTEFKQQNLTNYQEYRDLQEMWRNEDQAASGKDTSFFTMFPSS